MQELSPLPASNELIPNNSLNEQLIEACYQIDVDSIESLLKQGANPNHLVTSYEYGEIDTRAPLDIISGYRPYRQKNDTATLQAAALLLQYGANVNGGTSYTTPLHDAMSFSSSELVSLLLENGADVNARDEVGYTPLHILSGGYGLGSEPMKLSILLAYGPDTNVQDENGRTPAHIICGYNKEAMGLKSSLETLKKLASLGADFEIPNGEGLTVLMLVQNRTDLKEAIINGIIENALTTEDKGSLTNKVIETLSKFEINDISKLSAPEYEETKIAILDVVIEEYLISVYPDHILEHKLNQACLDRDVSKIEYLLKQGADPNYFTSLEFLEKNDPKLAPLNVITGSPFKHSNDAYEGLQLLLEYGANPNSVNFEGNSALHEYSNYTYFNDNAGDFVTLFINYDANLNLQNSNGDTPAHNILHDLNNNFKRYSDFSIQDSDSNYKYYSANELNILAKLIDAGADLTIENNQAETVVELAKNCALCTAMIELSLNISNDSKDNLDEEFSSVQLIDPVESIISDACSFKIDTILDTDNSLTFQNETPINILSQSPSFSAQVDLTSPITSNEVLKVEDILSSNNDVVSKELIQSESVQQPPSSTEYVCHLLPNIITQIMGICEHTIHVE